MSDRPPSRIDHNALMVEQARLARFFQSINKHRKAFDLAITDDFGGTLDPTEWRNAFESIEPRDANRTMVVTGGHSAMLNAYVEILRASAGSRLIGLLPHRRPHLQGRRRRRRTDRGPGKAAERALRPRGTAGARLTGRGRRGGPQRDRTTPPSTPGIDRKHPHLAAPSRHRTQMTLIATSPSEATVGPPRLV